jgi:hypothetical protein
MYLIFIMYCNFITFKWFVHEPQQWLDYGLNNQSLICDTGKDFSGAKPASHATNTGDSFEENIEAWHKTIYFHVMQMLWTC